MPNIAQLKAFAPAAIDKPEPEALWTLTCPGFNCMGACWDAKTGDAYIGGLARYAYDAKRGLGREWQIDGVTADLRNDSDGESLLRTFLAAPDIAWIEGERFLKLRERTYKLDKNGNLGRIVRIDNGSDKALREQQEQRTKGAADPYSLEALFGRFPTDTPTPTTNGNGDQLDWKRWEWVDGQGGPLDGKQQRGEYRDLTALPVEQAEAPPPTANSQLDRWHATRKDRDIVIQRRRFTGLKDDVPTWADSVSQVPAPGIFTHIIGLKYQPDRGIMDIAGQTMENPGGHEWQVGEIIRFTNWSTQPTLGVRLVFMTRGAYVPWGGEGFWQVEPFIDKPTSWDVAGDIAYVCNRTGAIRAYDLNKGNLIEWMDAGWAYPRQGEAELLWGGRTGVGGTVRGYQIYRADSAKGPFTKLALATGPTFRDKRPNGQPAWYRVATVNLVGEGPQSAPICAGAAETAVKRLRGNGTINTDGFDLTTRGNWQGVYGAEAARLAQDHVPEGVTPLPPRTFAAGWLSGFGPMWRGRNPVSPSDDPDRLQSARVPGMRCDSRAHTWSDPKGEIILSDGRPHILSLFMRKGTLHFSDSETGADLLTDVVVSDPNDAPARYVSYLVSGRFRLFIQAEGCGALFIDPVPTGK